MFRRYLIWILVMWAGVPLLLAGSSPQEAYGRLVSYSLEGDRDAFLAEFEKFHGWLEQPDAVEQARILYPRAVLAAVSSSNFSSDTPRWVKRSLDILADLRQQFPDQVEPLALSVVLDLFKHNMEGKCSTTNFAETEIKQWLDRALELGQENAWALYADAQYKSYGYGDTVVALEHLLGRIDSSQQEDASVQFMKPVALMMLANLKLNNGDRQRAYFYASALKAQAGDWPQTNPTYLRTLPQKATHVDLLRGLEWRELARDADQDGNNPEGVDAKALRMAEDPKTGHLWFEISYFTPPPFDNFGVNLVLDTDGDPENGSPWWGANPMKFDDLLTVWVRRDQEGNFYGSNALGMFGRAQRFVNKVPFAVDTEQERVFVALPAGAIQADQVRLIVATGLSNAWNDDLVEEGALTIKLPRVRTQLKP